MLGIVLLILFIMLFLVTLPTWPFSRKWGYLPTACFGLASLVILLLMLNHRL